MFDGSGYDSSPERLCKHQQIVWTRASVSSDGIGMYCAKHNKAEFRFWIIDRMPTADNGTCFSDFVGCASLNVS